MVVLNYVVHNVTDQGASPMINIDISTSGMMSFFTLCSIIDWVLLCFKFISGLFFRHSTLNRFMFTYI